MRKAFFLYFQIIPIYMFIYLRNTSRIEILRIFVFTTIYDLCLSTVRTIKIEHQLVHVLNTHLAYNESLKAYLTGNGKQHYHRSVLLQNTRMITTVTSCFTTYTLVFTSA